MAKFVTIGDGGRNGYDRTEEAIRDAEHEHDAIAQPGSEHGHRRSAHAGTQSHNAAGVEVESGPFMHSSLPVAGFAVAEAATMAEAVEIVSRTPCAVAHGVVEVWPLEQTPQADPATRSWSRSSSSHDSIHRNRDRRTSGNMGALSSDELITPRLRLRHWRGEDAEAMAAINRDPEVTRYLNRAVDEQAVQAFFGVVSDHWDQHGFGFYAVESREVGGEGRFIGFVGVAYPTFLPELAQRPELGWRLASDTWGRGLATEAATAARDDAFHRLALAELISIIHPENTRSRRLATKLGMSLERQIDNPVLDRTVDVWHIAR